MITPRSLWKFSRPLPAYATVIQVFAAYVLAMHHAGGLRLDVASLGPFVLTMLSALGLHVFVNGVNQVTDVEIDRINKSELPLASGAMSVNEGVAIAIGSALLAVVIAATQSMSLLITVCLCLLSGALYSLPPVRLKSSAFGAAFIIAITRGMILPLGMVSHFTHVLSGQPGVMFDAITLAVFAFGLVFAVALIKDIPDIDGDRQNGQRTVAILYGPTLTFNIAVGVMSLSYVLLIATGIAYLSAFAGALILVSHLPLLTFFLLRSRAVRLNDKASVHRYYKLFWQLLYVEYVLFPALCALV